MFLKEMIKMRDWDESGDFVWMWYYKLFFVIFMNFELCVNWEYMFISFERFRRLVNCECWKWIKKGWNEKWWGWEWIGDLRCDDINVWKGCDRLLVLIEDGLVGFLMKISEFIFVMWNKYVFFGIVFVEWWV